MALPDLFFDLLLPTGKWIAHGRDWLHHRVPYVNSFTGVWCDINWRLSTVGVKPGDECMLSLEAQDIRMGFDFRVHYGPHRQLLAELFQEYTGSLNYKGFLRYMLALEAPGLRVFSRKKYYRHWRGGYANTEKEITIYNLEELFTVPPFDPRLMRWIQFDMAHWVVQDVLLPRENFGKVYETWVPMMPPDFSPDQCRDLPKLFDWLYSPESHDFITYDQQGNLTTLPMSGHDEWYLNLWEAVRNYFRPGSSVILQDDGRVFWKILFMPGIVLYLREKL